LKKWIDGFEKNGLALEPRGRPVKESDWEQRLAVLALFDTLGPDIGLPTLQQFFGAMPKRELEDLARNYRKVHYDGKRVSVHALSWSHAGAVWAMDYTAPPRIIEQRFRTILVVRDLASGKLLLALPAEADSAQTTVDALRALFAEHGPPLVMKSDNGGHFVAQAVEALLEAHGVVHLRSPFNMPSYNGACEAGIGSLKIRAHIEAARHDRPGEWTLDDVEAARLRGNELGRPFGARCGSPDSMWADRSPLLEEARTQFQALVCQNRLEELSRRGYQDGTPVGESVRLSIGRASIGRALSQLGFVQYRRRSIPLPINPGLRSRIA
jgi:transposase InsO family protein